MAAVAGPMWKVKALTQLFLAHIPFGESLNHKLQLMNSLADERKLETRIEAIGNGLKRLAEVAPIDAATIVEVGTGWDALPTIMLYAAGARCINTYDHVRHLRVDLVAAAIRKLLASADLLSLSLGTPVEVIRERLRRVLAASEGGLADFLASANIVYHAPGDGSATGLPGNTIDIYYSYTVLEHVPEEVLGGIAAEARRVLKTEGVYYAAIWLHDQYSGFDPAVSPMNFLKYPEWVWSIVAKNKITYMNRLRERDFLDLLQKQQARVLRVNSILKPENVNHVKSMKVDRRFANYTPEELAVTFTEIIADWPDEAGGVVDRGEQPSVAPRRPQVHGNANIHGNAISFGNSSY